MPRAPLLLALIALVGCRSAGGVFRVPELVPSGGPALVSALDQSLGVRPTPGHQVTLLSNGEVFDAIVEGIARAERSIHIVMYIWEQGRASDRVSAALIARALEGLECRIVIDAFGSPSFSTTVQPALQAAGCEVRTFRPVPGAELLARNHRKIVVFDASSAITGGFGIRDDWLGDGVHGESWRDANVRFSGPAVAQAQQAFAENWQEAGGALLPEICFETTPHAGTATAAFVSSTGAPVTRAERLMQLVIAAARHRIWIANAYFVPSTGILDLLARKAAAGLDVRILAPGTNSDSKTAFGAQHLEYGSLQAEGVRVWEYEASMMHAKTVLVDDHLVVVGSINLDPLSLTSLEEGALVVDDRELARTLEATFVADLEHARELD